MPDLNVRYRRGAQRLEFNLATDGDGDTAMDEEESRAQHGFADYTLAPEKCVSCWPAGVVCRGDVVVRQRRRVDFASPKRCGDESCVHGGPYTERGALAFGIWSPSPYEIPALPNQLAPREPPGGSLAISSDRTQHGKD